MFPVRREVHAVSAYGTIRKETSFPDACFRLGLKRRTIGRLKDLCLSIPVEDVRELDCSFNFNALLRSESSGKSFIIFPS